MNGEPLDANAVVHRLRTLFGVTTDRELGHAMGVPNTTVSSWRTRNRVPYDECVAAVRKFRVSFDWLFLGQGEPHAEAPAYRIHDVGPGDERMQRLAGFLAHWDATRGADEKVWLEMQLARAVPEYAEWVAQRGKRG